MIDVNSMELIGKTFSGPNDYNQTNIVEFDFRDKFRNPLTIAVDLANNGAITNIYLNYKPLPENSSDFKRLDSFFVVGNGLHQTSNHDLLDALNGRIPNKVIKTIYDRALDGAIIVFQPRFNEYTGELTGCRISNIGPEDARLRFTCQSTGKDYDFEVFGNDYQVFKRPENVRAVTEAFMTGDLEVETQISRARANIER